MERGKSPCEYENLDLWWVYVVHTDGKYEYAQVNQFLNWAPKKPDDFRLSEKYTMRTNKWRQDKKYDRCKVHILKMGELLSDLEAEVAKKRPTVPRLVVETSDFLSEVSDIEGCSNGTLFKSGGTKRRATPADVAAKKSKAELVDMQKFATQLGCLFTEHSQSAGSSSASSKSETHQSKTSKLPKPKSSALNAVFDKTSIPSTSASASNNWLSAVKSTPKQSTSKQITSKKTTPNQSTPKQPTPKQPTPKQLTATAISSKKEVPMCRSTENQGQSSRESLQSGARVVNSKIIRNVELEFPSIASGPPKAKKIYTQDDIRRRDEEMERLKEQLRAAQAQIAFKDDAILGELRNLSSRVAKIEEAVSSKCRPDYINSVQLWLNNLCDSMHSASSSSLLM